MPLSRTETVSICFALAIAAELFLAWRFGLVSLTDISSAIAYFGVGSIIGSLVWGFRKRIESYLAGHAKKRVKPQRKKLPNPRSALNPLQSSSESAIVSEYSEKAFKPTFENGLSTFGIGLVV